MEKSRHSEEKNLKEQVSREELDAHGIPENVSMTRGDGQIAIYKKICGIKIKSGIKPLFILIRTYALHLFPLCHSRVRLRRIGLWRKSGNPVY